MGKTQLAISLMANLAGSAGPTLFCSAEMGKEALARRILSSTMDIKTRNLQKFTLGFDDTIKRWAGVPLMFDYRARSVRSVITSVRQAKRTHGIRAAAIDYLQLLEMDGSRTEEEEIGRASKAFKGLAEELEIPSPRQNSRIQEQRICTRQLGPLSRRSCDRWGGSRLPALCGSHAHRY